MIYNIQTSDGIRQLTAEETSAYELELQEREKMERMSESIGEIQRLESLLTPRRYRERDEGIEQVVNTETGEALKDDETGVAFITWVYGEIRKQQAIIRELREYNAR